MGQPVAPPPEAPAVVAPLHEVVIRKPAGPPVVKTGLTDAHGQPVTIACATCHATKEPNATARLGQELKLFHQGLTGAHANLACVSCHNPDEKYGSLRLADGSAVPYTEVMQLCAQCHGPQYRDYLHGAHGGMAGYWDLTKGPRIRNNCIDCHDPHSPKFPTVRPDIGPNDRDPHAADKQKEGGYE
jgi:formate-dependent nitrite reductase cytochrome c552 subunit